MAPTPVAAEAAAIPLGVDRAVVMGVLNVTADSFSDGGRYLDPAAAIARGRQLVADGADIIDVGGESTRPGAHRVSAATEADRVVPVIAELASDGVVCSVDTTRAEVAAAALRGRRPHRQRRVGRARRPGDGCSRRERGVPWILMHWRGHSADMDALARYDDVVADVRAELLDRVAAAVAAGVDESRIVLDPGLGFAKTAEHNWPLLRALPAMTGELGTGWGFPVLIGASRKRFLGALLADAAGPRPPDGREAATTAISALAAAAGAWGVRVHEASASLDAVRVAAAATGSWTRSRICRCPARRRSRQWLTGSPSPGSASTVITASSSTRSGTARTLSSTSRIWLDLSAAAATDDLTRTVHYGELAELAAGIVGGPPKDLIEAVAGEIAEAVLARFPVSGRRGHRSTSRGRRFR